MPVSSMPPHHTGTPLATHTSWMRRASRYPPTRPGLMLTMAQAPRAMASAAARAEVMLSSRQSGVRSSWRQRGVLAQVVLGEWLLDQQQVELVEAGEVAGVAERVGAVGVDLEHDVGPDVVAHGGHEVDVAARARS